MRAGCVYSAYVPAAPPSKNPRRIAVGGHLSGSKLTDSVWFGTPDERRRHVALAGGASNDESQVLRSLNLFSQFSLFGTEKGEKKAGARKQCYLGSPINTLNQPYQRSLRPSEIDPGHEEGNQQTVSRWPHRQRRAPIDLGVSFSLWLCRASATKNRPGSTMLQRNSP